MDISFLIPTKNRPNDLDLNLDSINNLNFINIDYEIIVLDDGSSVNYNKIISKYKFVNYYKNECSIGISRARNKLAYLAKGKYLIFIDDDVTLDKDINLDVLYQLFETDNKLGLIAFNITALLGSDILPEQYNNNDNSNSNVQKAIKQIPFKKYQLFFSPILSENVNYVSYFIGAAFACKKSIFDERITFDELFFWGNEELDFSYNLIKNEYKLMYHPAFKANHYPRRSVIDKNDKKINSLNLFIANRILTAYKFLPFINAFLYITIWTTYYLILSIFKFRFDDWIVGVKMGIRKTNLSNRYPLSNKNMTYLKKNFGRINY